MGSKGGGGQPQQQGGSADNSTDFLWMIAGTIIVCGLVWYFGKAYIVQGVFHVRKAEIHGINSLAVFLGLQKPVLVQKWLAYINNPYVNVAEVDFSTLQDLSAAVGRYLCYPICVVLVILAAYLYTTNVASQFKNIFTMEKLRKKEVAVWPAIKPVVDAVLVDQDIDDGPWAMSEQPLQFAKKYGLLKEKSRYGQITLSLIPGAAHARFSLQMGPLWQGLEALPPYVQALFAIFAAKGGHDNQAAAQMMAQISRSVGTGKLDFSGVRALLVKHVRSKGVGRAVGIHAYLYTVMPSMLVYARTAGVLATAEFLWLKAVDRQLWYVLNSVGRLTVFPEVAGPYAHWLVEKRLRRPLKTPMVAEAVRGLEQAIAEIKYNPDRI